MIKEELVAAHRTARNISIFALLAAASVASVLLTFALNGVTVAVATSATAFLASYAATSYAVRGYRRYCSSSDPGLDLVSSSLGSSGNLQ
jgi:hypothetical protein